MRFKVGKNIGDILLGISQEALKFGNTKKVFSTYTESLPGFSENYIIQILKGELYLKTLDDNITVELIDGKDPDATYYDWSSWFKESVDSINNYRDAILNVIGKSTFNYHVDLSDTSEPSYNMVIRLIEGESNIIHETLYDHIKYNVEILDECTTQDRILYEIVEYNYAIKKLLDILNNHLSVYGFLKLNGFQIDHVPFYSDTIQGAIKLLVDYKIHFNILHSGITNYLVDFKNSIDKVLNYFDITKEYLENEILESNILDGYDAGWISPEGKFYGGIGKVSDMLHRHIAENLTKNDHSILFNSESELEKKGWIKIHGNDVYGCFTRGLFPTDIQVKKICDYIDKFYEGIFWNEPEILGTRSPDAKPLYTNKVRQMDKFNLKNIFTI